MSAPELGWIGTHRSQDHLFVLSNRGVSTELSPCQEPPHWEWSPPGSPGTPPLAPQEQQRPHSTRSGDMQLPSPILCPSLLSLPLWLPPNPWDCPSGVWWSWGGLLSPTHTFEGTAGSGWVRRHPSSRSHPAVDTPCPLSTKSGSPEGKTGSFPPSKGWGEAALHNRPYRLFPAGGMARLGSAWPRRAPTFPPRSSEQGQSRRCIAPSRAGPPAAASSRPFPGLPGTSCSRRLEKRCPEAGQSRRFRHSRSDTPTGRPSHGDLHGSGSPAPPGP